MIKIRKNMFETNSSSVHSIVYSKEGLEESKLAKDKDNYILASYGTFDTDTRYYNTQAEKLSYLLTQIFYLAGGWNEDISDDYRFEELEEIVCKYAHADGIRVLSGIEPYIDHQSVPEWDTIINLWDEDEVINFIFNKNIMLKTDCD